MTMTTTMMMIVMMMMKMDWSYTLTNEKRMEDTFDYQLVVAIDIGTTYSSYAFSFRHEYLEDPLDVEHLPAKKSSLESRKDPTSVLFNPNGTFISFGHDAEDTYFDLAKHGDHVDWYYFRRFKLKLYEKQQGLILEAYNGKSKPAKDVISNSIGYLKNHMLSRLKREYTDLKESDIRWVLTVPAVWDDPAKELIKEAAGEAGIEISRLILSPEPDATSAYFKHIPAEEFTGGISPFSVGVKFIVLDAGGGTTDITVYEVQTNNSLKELYKANSRDCSGMKVDEAFRTLLEEIVGNDVLDTFSKTYTFDMLEMYRDFETKKRAISPGSDTAITFTIPISLDKTYTRFHKGKTINDSLAMQLKYKGKLTRVGDKLKMDTELAKGLFDSSLKVIVAHLREVLSKESVQGCQSLLMVGGFAESLMLQNAIKSNFKDLRLTVTELPELSMLIGAVIYGHDAETNN